MENIEKNRGKLNKKIIKKKNHVCVDTRFCTNDLIKEDDWNDHLYTQKSWLHYMH